MTKFASSRENNYGQYFIFLFKQMIQREADVKKVRWLPWRWQTLFTMCGIKKLANDSRMDERGEMGFFFFFFSAEMNECEPFISGAPTNLYHLPTPKPPLSEAEHLEGIEKTRHGWNNNRKPLLKTYYFFGSLPPHPLTPSFFFFLKKIYVCYMQIVGTLTE